jgi:hypothetical protein
MMKWKTGLVVLAAAVAMGAAGAEAGSIDRREARQRARVADGVRDGSLTCREAARLGREQLQIRREEQRYRRDDGRLDAAERAELQRELDQASRHIYRQKHDRQAR